MDEFVGFLQDEGYSPKEIRELVGPLVPHADEELATVPNASDPGGRRQALVDVLKVAQVSRQPPGPQVAVPSGVLNSLPQAADAKAVRVDTEESYKEFRKGGAQPTIEHVDQPENSYEVTDALQQMAEGEMLGNIMDYGAASQGSLFAGTHVPLSTHQACLFCGVKSGHGHPICLNCVKRPELFVRGYASQIIGYEFERGYASQMIGKGKHRKHKGHVVGRGGGGGHGGGGHGGGHGGHFTRGRGGGVGVPWGWGGGWWDGYYDDPLLDEVRALRRYGVGPILGFGERGSAAALYDDNPSATLGEEEHSSDVSEMLGASWDPYYYRLPVQNREYDDGSPLVGGDGFYRLPHQVSEYGYDGVTAMIGDVSALAVPSTVYAEQTPLSFRKADQQANVVGWKQGDHLYSSIRVTGWDGKPRILTATTPYQREVGVVVGYCESARISPTHTIAILDPLARQLGSSALIPRLAAAAPAVLRVSADKTTPHIVAVMGAR